MSNLGDQMVDIMAAHNAGYNSAREEYRKTIAKQADRIAKLEAVLREIASLQVIVASDMARAALEDRT